MKTHVAENGVSQRSSPLRVRASRFDFSEVPRHWFAGSASATHLTNGVNLLFPAGERFFVRSVRHYIDRVDDERLLADVRGFFGQEGRHANAHEKFFAALRAQGYEFEPLLKVYEGIIAAMEKTSPAAIRLSVTVALEHFTAVVAEDALGGGRLNHAHSAMRQLFEWHAVEELEHKAVAFDVLAKVNPSYALRIAGLVIGGAWLGGFWLLATRHLLHQDGLSLREGARQLRELRKSGELLPDGVFKRVFVRGIREYLRPDFHPNDKDHRSLVVETLARLEREGVM